MIEIKKILKRDVPALFSNNEFWENTFLPISKHRLYAHFKNPNLKSEDIVLLLAYLDEEMVGYMGVFIDYIKTNSIERRIGWLSTWWVHPKTKGTGIGREILNSMYKENDGYIGISQFTASAKRVYDKSGYFTTLKENKGIKAVLRSNLAFVVPIFFPNLNKMSPYLNKIDGFLNFFINFKLAIQAVTVRKELVHIKVEYLSVLDNECISIIKKFSTNDLSEKTPQFFEWLKAYKWVLKAPLIEMTDDAKYQFSMYDGEFEIFFIKILERKQCVGFIVLQKRNYVSKVLFTYFDTSKHSKVVSNIIKLENIKQNTREIICYAEPINDHLRKSKIFLYNRKKLKHSLISQAFNQTNFEHIRMNFGDGDCSFA